MLIAQAINRKHFFLVAAAKIPVSKIQSAPQKRTPKIPVTGNSYCPLLMRTPSRTVCDEIDGVLPLFQFDRGLGNPEKPLAIANC
jgi:hypothetical protein